MNTKMQYYILKEAVVVLLVMFMLSACGKTASHVQKGDAPVSKAVSFDKLEWEREASVYNRGSFRYYLKKSLDNKYGWLTKVEITGTDKLRKMIFPKELDGALLLRIGFDERELEEGAELFYNLFGNRIDSEGIQYNNRNNKSGNIEELVIPDSVQSIEGSAFAGLYSLKRIKLPVYLKRLCGGAFYDCTGLTNVEIGKKLEELRPLAFEGCSQLGSIRISSDNNNYCEWGGFILDKRNWKTVMAVPAKENLVIPAQAQSIGKYSFANSKVGKIRVERGNAVFAEDGDCIYRRDNQALAVGVVKRGEVIIPDKVKELNGDSLLAGGKVERIYMPTGLEYLRGEWLDMVGGDCIYIFYNEKLPQIVEPSGRTASVPMWGSKVMVPRKLIQKYSKWLKENGSEIPCVELK